MSEIQEGEIEEVGDQDQFSNQEESTDEEHHKSKLEKVVEDEMASNSSSCLNMFGFVREEMPYVDDLEEEEGEPTVVSNVSRE
jgi:hypothetical protein